jgi:hypothetical protein
MAQSGEVWKNLLKASEMIELATLELHDLTHATYHLHNPDNPNERRRTVVRYYTNWLSDCNIVGVRINAAFQAAQNKPPAVSQWWKDLADHEIHAFFKEERHRGLKEVEEVLVSKVIAVGDGRDMAYWAFPQGPHEGDPVVPRCQQYMDWLYEGMWAPAAQLLFPWTFSERQEAPEHATIFGA